MKYEPLTPEPGERTHATIPDRIIETMTHGFHTFCVHDVQLGHLMCLLALCAVVLGVRWWGDRRARAEPHRRKCE